MQHKITDKNVNIKMKNIYDNVFRLTIKKENRELICIIDTFNNSTLKENKYSFNLISLLKRININKYDNNVYNVDNYANIFENKIKFLNDKSFPFFLDEIKNMIKNNPYYDFKDIECIARKHNIVLDCELFDNKLSIYNCNSLSEIIYAILHYLLEKTYKVNVCKYCERFLIVKTFKTSYCQDVSPYCYEYEGKNCQYVREERIHLLNSKRKTIDSKLFLNNYSKEKIVGFQNKCNKFRDEIKKNPNVWNINDYKDFLYKVENSIKKI